MMPSRRIALAAGACVVALGTGLALYGTRATGGNAPDASAPCAGSTDAARRVDGAARGQVAAMQALAEPKPAPAISFKNREGAEVTLADLKGKLLLVNLWATWCAPCKAEMPALDRLQGELGGDAFGVIAINVDTRNLDKPPKWLADAGIKNLGFYADPGGRVLPVVQRETSSPGLPTTMLIDAKGCAIGVMKGPAEWASDDAKALIRAALGTGS